MKIYIMRSISGGSAKCRIFTSEFSQNDIVAMEAFSQPAIDLGGVFGTGPDAFELPNVLAELKTDSPFVQGFPVGDLGLEEAKRRGLVWSDEIVARIKAALDALRAMVDEFTAESQITYPEMPALRHNTLSGRDDEDTHPASSITNDSGVDGGTVTAALDWLKAHSGGAEHFTDLDDAPSSYGGQAGKIISVNAGEDGLEFIDNVPQDPWGTQTCYDNAVTHIKVGSLLADRALQIWLILKAGTIYRDYKYAILSDGTVLADGVYGEYFETGAFPGAVGLMATVNGNDIRLTIMLGDVGSQVIARYRVDKSPLTV